MKISLNWLKKYVDIKIPDEELITLIGARLVEVEGVIDESKKYDNIFVVKVVECEPIEGTHLHLCRVDVGTTAPTVQVVCGAPNVRAGMLAAWIAPGATVPASIHEDAPFVIGTRKMLGKYESHGMLAGADELDFGDDHSGIVEIDPKIAQPGDKLSDIFELNDKILEIENKSLTHRPDCFGIIGFAREVAGILNQKFSEPDIFKSFDTAHAELVSMQDPEKSCPLSAQIKDAKICPYYSAAVLDYTRVPTEKRYLTLSDTLLAKSGMRPISPIVDLTNYLMLLTGQPLHAFDYDKFVAVGGTNDAKIIVRNAMSDEKLILLDGVEAELNENDIIITSNNIPVALAGAMGGKNTEIDDSTKRIILESATFSLYHLRKTQMSHGIFSEAITRFTKGQPTTNCLPVLNIAVKNLGGKILALTSEYAEAIANGGKIKDNVVEITTQEINSLLGTDYSELQIVQTLENVGFQNIFYGHERAEVQKLCLKVPEWRTDIHIKEDIIEEVGRLNGYDNIPKTIPLHATAEKNPLFTIKKDIRNKLSTLGAHEMLTYSFIHGDLMKTVGQNPKNAFRITNSISPDLQYFRQTIVPSLLTKARDNLKAQFDHFAIFEMNQVFSRDSKKDSDDLPEPQNHLALVVANRNGKTQYYLAKKYLMALIWQFGFYCEVQPFHNTQSETYFEPKRSADLMIGDAKIGSIGEIKARVAHALKLPVGTAAFEVDLSQLAAHRDRIQLNQLAFSDYPSVSRDLTVHTTKPFAKIYQQICQTLIEQQLVFVIAPTAIYQPDSADFEGQNLSFHLRFANPTKTLAANEIAELMAKLEKIS